MHQHSGASTAKLNYCIYQLKRFQDGICFINTDPTACISHTYGMMHSTDSFFEARMPHTQLFQEAALYHKRLLPDIRETMLAI